MFSFTSQTRVKSSKHIVHGTQVSEVSSDSGSCQTDCRYILMHAITPSNRTLACFPSNVCVTEDHVYRTTGLDRLKKDACIYCL